MLFSARVDGIGPFFVVCGILKVCMLSFLREQNMYPNWMLDDASFSLHDIGDGVDNDAAVTDTILHT